MEGSGCLQNVPVIFRPTVKLVLFSLQKPDVRLSRGSIDREDGGLQGLVSSGPGSHQDSDLRLYGIGTDDVLWTRSPTFKCSARFSLDC